MIRAATEQDIDAVYELIQQFEDNSLKEYSIACGIGAKDIMKKLINTSFVIDNNGVKGVISGLLTSFPLNPTDKIYQEVIWYVHKDHRRDGIKLYKHLENWCRKNDIRKIAMVCMYNSNHDKLMRFYKRLGYRPMETQLIKEI